MGLISCPPCGRGVSSDHATCPHCGAHRPRRILMKLGIGAAMLLGAAIGLLLLGLVLGNIHRNDPPTTSITTR